MLLRLVDGILNALEETKGKMYRLLGCRVNKCWSG